MLRLFNTVPHVVLSPTITLFLLTIHNCDFAAVVNHNANILGNRDLPKGLRCTGWETLVWGTTEDRSFHWYGTHTHLHWCSPQPSSSGYYFSATKTQLVATFSQCALHCILMNSWPCCMYTIPFQTRIEKNPAEAKTQLQNKRQVFHYHTV